MRWKMMNFAHAGFRGCDFILSVSSSESLLHEPCQTVNLHFPKVFAKRTETRTNLGEAFCRVYKAISCEKHWVRSVLMNGWIRIMASGGGKSVADYRVLHP